MLRISKILAISLLIGLMLACGPESEKSLGYYGQVGHLKQSHDFFDFLLDHEDVVADFNLQMRNVDTAADSFTLWLDCPEELYPGEKPSTLKCRGLQVSIWQKDKTQPNGLSHSEDLTVLRGRYKIGMVFSRQNGAMNHCTLIPAEQVPQKLAKTTAPR